MYKHRNIETTQRNEIESLCETLKNKRDILLQLDSENIEEITEENSKAKQKSRNTLQIKLSLIRS